MNSWIFQNATVILSGGYERMTDIIINMHKAYYVYITCVFLMHFDPMCKYFKQTSVFKSAK